MPPGNLLVFQKLLRNLRPATLLKKETLAQVFSCEFCKISKNTFFTENLWTTASGVSLTFYSETDIFHSQECLHVITFN